MFYEIDDVEIFTETRVYFDSNLYWDKRVWFDNLAHSFVNKLSEVCQQYTKRQSYHYHRRWRLLVSFRKAPLTFPDRTNIDGCAENIGILSVCITMCILDRPWNIFITAVRGTYAKQNL